MKNLLAFLLLSVGIFRCNQPAKESKEETSKKFTSQLKYATKFKIEDQLLTVTEPWPGAVRPIKYTPETTPKRIIVTSTTHLPYLELLGLEDRLVGFPSTQYITSPKIRKLVEQGKITDLGPDGSLNLELLISLEPDAVFAFDMGNESTSLDKIKEAGIDVIYDSDYLETSSLGRAEWIKFFGAFFNKEAEADSIFQAIEYRYDSLKQMTTDVKSRPTVLSGVMYGDIWFLPGGENWAAGFYKDAGGNYLWSEDSTSGWLEISFESVFDKAHAADFWIGTSTLNTRDEIAGQDARYAAFEAYKNGAVYNYNKRKSPSGGLDFFESGYARPDIVLTDLIAILHPELLPDYETYYFQQLP